MRSEEKTIAVFYANDGKEFLNRTECERYEEAQISLNHRLAKLKFYTVSHSPDLTEGRGYYGLMHVAVEGWEGHAALFSACFAAFGVPMAYVQGVAPMPAWTIHDSTQQGFLTWKRRNAQVGDYKYPASALFISDGDPVAEMPVPLRIKDVNDKAKVYSAIVKGPPMPDQDTARALAPNT